MFVDWLSASLCLSVSVSMCVSLTHFLSMSLLIYWFQVLCLCLSVCLSVSVSLSLSLSIYLCVGSVRLFVYSFVRFFACNARVMTNHCHCYLIVDVFLSFGLEPTSKVTTTLISTPQHVEKPKLIKEESTYNYAYFILTEVPKVFVNLIQNIVVCPLLGRFSSRANSSYVWMVHWSAWVDPLCSSETRSCTKLNFPNITATISYILNRFRYVEKQR